MLGQALGMGFGLSDQLLQQQMAYYNQANQMSILGGLQQNVPYQTPIQSTTDEHLLVLLCEE